MVVSLRYAKTIRAAVVTYTYREEELRRIVEHLTGVGVGVGLGLGVGVGWGVFERENIAVAMRDCLGVLDEAPAFRGKNSSHQRGEKRDKRCSHHMKLREHAKVVTSRLCMPDLQGKSILIQN